MSTATPQTAPLATPKPPPDHLPHDIYELIPYPFGLEPWMWALIILALALLLGALGWWWWKKRQSPKPIEKVNPLAQLDQQLLNMIPPKPFAGKEQGNYYYSLGITFRRYMEHCTDIRATDLTLRELKPLVKDKAPLDPEALADALYFFERSDMVKFAGVETSRHQAEQDHEAVLVWTKALKLRHLQQQQEKEKEAGRD